jgi:hypothetical protein
MQHSPRIPEIAQRERFMKRVVQRGGLFAVAGEEGLARVPSRHFKGREVTLLWSSRIEAERWANVVAKNPRIKELPLSEVLGGLLPSLAGSRRLIGPDWSAEPIELELEPRDLADRLRLETLEAFVAKARSQGSLFILEDSSGPALLVSATRPDLLVLPCWAERDLAETRIEGPWRDMMALEIPLASFVAHKLQWLSERGFLVAPDHRPDAGQLELQPGDLAARLSPSI